MEDVLLYRGEVEFRVPGRVSSFIAQVDFLAVAGKKRPPCMFCNGSAQNRTVWCRASIERADGIEIPAGSRDIGNALYAEVPHGVAYCAEHLDRMKVCISKSIEDLAHARARAA